MSCGSLVTTSRWPTITEISPVGRIANVCGHRLTRHRTIARAGDVLSRLHEGARPGDQPHRRDSARCPHRCGQKRPPCHLGHVYTSLGRSLAIRLVVLSPPSHRLVRTAQSTGSLSRRTGSRHRSRGSEPQVQLGTRTSTLSRLTRVSIAGSGFRAIVARVGCPGEVESSSGGTGRPACSARLGDQRASLVGAHRAEAAILPSRVKSTPWMPPAENCLIFPGVTSARVATATQVLM